ncbi:hypothetical protein FHG87_021714 [Trinorchestia longiramus]|nr:hypothetical protein FHG87_021714 [Trinorchestia longiramus]
MHTNSQQQHVNEPTRQNNILDLVMTTPDIRIIGLQVTDKIGRTITQRMELHEIRGHYYRRISNWLTGRTQRVMIHDQASDSKHVTSGVLQRSVLSLLLFTIYYTGYPYGLL